MKTWFRQSGMLAALALAFAHPTYAVVNGGFETGDFTGWDRSNEVFSGVLAAAAHTGGFGARFGAVGSENLLFQTVVPTTPGGTYSLDFWLRNLSGSTVNAFSAWWDGAPVMTLSNAAAFEYTGFSLPVVATAASTVIEFHFRHDPSFWYFDDVSVTAVGVPDGAATVTLLALGFLGLHLMRRQRR